MPLQSQDGEGGHDSTVEQHPLGGYVLGRLLGSGGMGTVYEGRHPTLGKRVALKVVKTSLADHSVARERFFREARALALVSHPHVVEVFDLGVEGERAFIVMELLDGETLEALLARKGRLGVSRTVDLLLPVVSAAAAIHDTGVVHRDLKPGNVMLARRGRCAVEPVVLDFGISRSADTPSGQDGLTEPQLLVGTLSYLAPEQLRDARAAGPQSDQYAVGVMLYECATGRKPFTGADRYELIHAAMTAKLVAPSEIVPEISKSFDAVVLRALDRRPDSRFPSMRALGAALLSFADRPAWKRWAGEFAGLDPAASGETAGDIRTPLPIPARPTRRVGRSVGLTFGVLALAAIALAVRARTSAPPRPSPGDAALPSATLTASATTTTRPAIEPPPPAAALPIPEPLPPAAPARVRTPGAGAAARQTARARTAASPPVVNGAPPPAKTAPSTGKPAQHAEMNDAIDPFAPVR
jgi:eukaryotic-like serine/threonine-protein kinase